MTSRRVTLQLIGIVAAAVFAAAPACVQHENSEVPMHDEGWIEVDPGVRLYFRSYPGGADALVLLHGGPGSTSMGVGPDLLSLGEHHHLLLYDQRGGGRSDPDPYAAQMTVHTHVDDLEAVRRHFQWGRITLIGHSWGAVLAAFYAAQHPEHVDRMILVGPMEPTWQLGDQRDRALSAGDPGGEQELTLLSQRPDLAGDALALCRARFKIIQRRYYYDLLNMTRKRGDYCDVPPDAIGRAEIIEQVIIKSLGKYDLRPMLARLQVPVLVVEGAQTPISLESYRVWAGSLANSRLWLIDHVGHAYPFVEAPEVFFPGIEGFLRGQWPQGAISITH